MAEYDPSNPARMKIPKPFVHSHGAGHQTPAHRTLLNLALGGLRRVAGKHRRKRKTKHPKVHRKHAKHARRGKAHLVPGSKAARSHMARLRKMRGAGKAAAKAAA